jgi:hypothetical protein
MSAKSYPGNEARAVIGLALGLGPIDSGLARKKAVYTPLDTPETSCGKTPSAARVSTQRSRRKDTIEGRFRTRPRIRLMRA